MGNDKQGHSTHSMGGPRKASFVDAFAGSSVDALGGTSEGSSDGAFVGALQEMGDAVDDNRKDTIPCTSVMVLPSSLGFHMV